MTKSQFIKLLRLMKAEDERNRKLYRLGVDLIDANEMGHSILKIVAVEAFGEEGWDWITWWQERNYGRDITKAKPGAWNGDGKPLIWNETTLWREVCKKQVAETPLSHK